MIMKRFTFIATALVALASCSDSEFVGDQNTSQTSQTEQGAIAFGTGVNTVTRATHTGADAAGLLNNKFVFAGTKSKDDGGTTTLTDNFVFDQYTAKWVDNTANTTESNSNNWEYVAQALASTTNLPSGATQTIKYWDYSQTQYDFAAYSLGVGADADKNPSTPNTFAVASAITFADINDGDPGSYTLTGKVGELTSCYISDLVTAYNRNNVNDFGNVVTFTFRSLAAKVRMALYETVPGYSVKDVKFYAAESPTALATDGTEDVARLFTPLAAKSLPTGSGKMTITFPTTGWANSPHDGNVTDYNKAHVAFTPTNAATDMSSTLELAALDNFAVADGVEDAGDYLGRASNAATYAGGKVGSPAAGKYFTILPNEDGTDLILRIKYTLVSTDGSDETITVDNATAVVPAEYTKWNPNYAYTYIFKISDYTSGSTGKDGDGNTITGLTPITFDAVVIDSEDGLQETITTVSTPSITTYAKGEVVTANNEYKVGNNIYAVVTNAGENQTLTKETNAWLYTVTLADGSAQVISEATVDNAIANGKYDASAGTFTVTDANTKNMVVTLNNGLNAITAIPAADSPNGNELTITGAKFTPDATGTYVLRYQVSAPVYDAGTLGSALTAAGITKLDGYFTYDDVKYIQCDSEAAPVAGTNYYKVQTPGKYMYKVVKVIP